MVSSDRLDISASLAADQLVNSADFAVWFLQDKALRLPQVFDALGKGKIRKTGDDTPDFYDPYDKSPLLSSLLRFLCPPMLPAPLRTASFRLE